MKDKKGHRHSSVSSISIALSLCFLALLFPLSISLLLPSTVYSSLPRRFLWDKTNKLSADATDVSRYRQILRPRHYHEHAYPPRPEHVVFIMLYSCLTLACWDLLWQTSLCQLRTHEKSDVRCDASFVVIVSRHTISHEGTSCQFCRKLDPVAHCATVNWKQCNQPIVSGIWKELLLAHSWFSPVQHFPTLLNVLNYYRNC